MSNFNESSTHQYGPSTQCYGIPLSNLNHATSARPLRPKAIRVYRPHDRTKASKVLNMNASDFTNEQMNKPDPIPAQPTPAAGGAKKDAPKLITYVFEIVDEKLWDEQRNPMYRDNAAIPGLKCVGMSVGDLLSMAEAFEDAAPEAYETAHNEHVMKHLNSGAHASPRGKPETTP